MNIRIIFTIALLAMTSCNSGYGPMQDYSQFTSARLAPDKRTVLFSFHRYAYRPAAGWRAFPDGGIPRYIRDVNILGTYDLQTSARRILLRQKNTEWQPGSGVFTIHDIKGTVALVSQGGQLRGAFKLGGRHFLVDLNTGSAKTLDLKSDLARFGRDVGPVYLVDTNGTLLFVNLSLQEAESQLKQNRSDSPVPEIWVRTAPGDYARVAASSHYQCTTNGEVIYWEPSTRDFSAFSITARTTRKAPEFKIPPFTDVVEGASLSSDRKSLELGTRLNGEWKYQPLDIKTEILK